MAAAKLRSFVSRSTMVVKRSISFYKAKSGLMVPEGYEKTSTFEDIKGSVEKNWYKIDESARTAVIQSIVKYVFAAATCSGTLMFLNTTREKLSNLQSDVDAAKEERKTMKEVIKSVEERVHQMKEDNDDKIKKIEAEMNNLKIVSRLWLSRLTSKRFDPKVLSRVGPEDFYDPVKIMQSHHNSEEANPSEERIIKLKVLFSVHSINGQGIPSKELGAVMESVGKKFSDSELKAMIKEVDANGKGSIEFSRFLHLMLYQLKNDDTKHDLREAFDIIDKDHDGYILAAELSQLMTHSGENLFDLEVKKRLEEADTEGETRLSFDDFKGLMLSK